MFIKKIIFTVFLYFFCVNFFAETFVVCDFETDSFCLENKTASMSSLLIDELVSIEGITVLERNRLNDVIRELNFGNTIYSDINSVKSIGKMLNADYVITGNTNFIGSELVITARLIEVETAKIVCSTKMHCHSWNEFYSRLEKFSENLVGKYITKPSTINHLLGVWRCKVDNIYYEIVFNKNSKCKIMINKLNDSFIKGETIEGIYSYGKEKISNGSTLKIQALSKGPKHNIEWSGFYNFLGKDFSSFNAQFKTQEGRTIHASFIKVR